MLSLDAPCAQATDAAALDPVVGEMFSASVRRPPAAARPPPRVGGHQLRLGGMSAEQSMT